MVGKKKLRYKNFNICQLVDKGKLKLHYFDEYKEAKEVADNGGAIKEKVSADEANELKAKFEEAGATIELK